MHPVTANIRGKEYSGNCTEFDGLFFLSFLLKDLQKYIDAEEGIEGMYSELGSEEAIAAKKILDETDGKDPAAVSGTLFGTWSERLYIRLNYNQAHRALWCDRVLSIFPDMDRTLIDLKAYTENKRYYVERCLIALSAEEIMSIMMPMISAAFAAAPKSEIPKRSAKAKSSKVSVAEPVLVS